MPQSILDGRKGFADAGIVHNATVFERHIEINAHEHTVAIEWEITNRKLGHGWSFLWEGSAGTRAGRRERILALAAAAKRNDGATGFFTSPCRRCS
jgi:hypothetical protein